MESTSFTQAVASLAFIGILIAWGKVLWNAAALIVERQEDDGDDEDF